MKKALTGIILFISMMIGLFTQGVQPVSAALAFPSLSTSAYCEFSAIKRIPVYRDSALKTRGTSSPAKSYSAEIYVGDICRVLKITSNYVQLQYPTSSGYKTGFINRSALIGVANPTDNFTSKGKVTTYVSAGGKSYGYTEAGDKIYTVGVSGSYTAIIYTAKSGNRAFKFGYVLTSEYKSKIIGAPPVYVFNHKTITYAYLLNDANAVPNKNAYKGPEGHNGLLLVDVNGCGVYYSFGPDGYTRKTLLKEQVNLLLTYGFVNGYGREYTRSLVQRVPSNNVAAIYHKAQSYLSNPPKYNGLTFNCTILANEILKAGGLVYCSTAIPNSGFNRMEEYLGSKCVKVMK